MNRGWNVEFAPITWFFGPGYTVFYRMCEWGGNEIHVEAMKPVRKVCMDIINKVGGLWWTSISPDNKRAINLCLKCGFSLFEQKTVTDGFSGKLVTMNIYRRLSDV